MNKKNIIWTKIDFGEPGSFLAVLQKGLYKIECWGAAGGIGCQNGVHSTQGGPGAYTSGKLFLNKKTKFFCFVGGKGADGSSEKNTRAQGGFNGGGMGEDINDNDGSGAGGGATDIRYINGSWYDTVSLSSRIMVAAGGSGSAFSENGAPGGDLNGYIKTGDDIDDIVKSDTGQNGGYDQGRGEDGKPHHFTPSSGAGGGYYGGKAGEGIEKPVYQAVSSSGSSYISGYPGCDPNNMYIFTDTVMKNGNKEFFSPSGQIEKGHSGNGFILITLLSPIDNLTCQNHFPYLLTSCLFVTILL